MRGSTGLFQGAAPDRAGQAKSLRQSTKAWATKT